MSNMLLTKANLNVPNVTALKVALQAGFMVPVTVAPTVGAGGSLVGGTVSGNFVTSAALTWGAEADNSKGDPSTTVAAGSIVQGGTSVAETIVGFQLMTAGSQVAAYCPLPRAIQVPAGNLVGQLNFILQVAIPAYTGTPYNNSSLGYVGV